MTTLAAATPARPGASLAGASITVAGRTLRKFLRTPQLIVVGTIQGAMFLLIFRYVFGGAIQTGATSYVDFVIPGFVATIGLFVGTATAAGVAEDLEQGFVDRLRSLPIPRFSALAGRVLGDTAMLAWNLAVTAGVGFAVGFRLHGSVLDGLAAFGLSALFAFAFMWMFVAMGLYAGSAQAAQGMSLMVFPFAFVSSVYVPASSMPGWLRGFAEHQPITVMVDAVRGLALGHGAGHDVVLALLWSAGLVAVFAPIAVARFQRV